MHAEKRALYWKLDHDTFSFFHLSSSITAFGSSNPEWVKKKENSLISYQFYIQLKKYIIIITLFKNFIYIIYKESD